MSPNEQLTAPVKLGLLGCLYFSQGLPFGFFTQALPVLMRKQGFSLAAIGLSSLVALPWALKFLWAPAVACSGSIGSARADLIGLLYQCGLQSSASYVCGPRRPPANNPNTANCNGNECCYVLAGDCPID